MLNGGTGGRGRGGWLRRVADQLAVAAGHTGCRGPLRAAGNDGRGTVTKEVNMSQEHDSSPWIAVSLLPSWYNSLWSAAGLHVIKYFILWHEGIDILYF